MFTLAFLMGNPVEWGIILVIVLVLFGGAKLPSLMKGMGEGIKEFKKATQDEETAPTPPAAVPVGTTKPEEKP